MEAGTFYSTPAICLGDAVLFQCVCVCSALYLGCARAAAGAGERACCFGLSTPDLAFLAAPS